MLKCVHMFNIDRLVRPELVALGGYSAHQAPENLPEKIPAERVIKLDANENPYGCSPEVQRALAEYRGWHTYPDAGQAALRRQLQDYTGVDAGCIVAANGSGELLDYILCLFLAPGDEVINCPPTFDLYRLRTLINGGKLVNISRKEDFSLDVKAIKAAITTKTKLIILNSPHPLFIDRYNSTIFLQSHCTLDFHSTLNQFYRVNKVSGASVVSYYLCPGHFLDQNANSAGVVQVNMGYHYIRNIPWFKTKFPYTIENNRSRGCRSGFN